MRYACTVQRGSPVRAASIVFSQSASGFISGLVMHHNATITRKNHHRFLSSRIQTSPSHLLRIPHSSSASSISQETSPLPSDPASRIPLLHPASVRKPPLSRLIPLPAFLFCIQHQSGNLPSPVCSPTPLSSSHPTT